VEDIEFGVEWQPYPNFELVVEYYISDRRYEDELRPDWQQSGRLLRVQAQFNF